MCESLLATALRPVFDVPHLVPLRVVDKALRVYSTPALEATSTSTVVELRCFFSPGRVTDEILRFCLAHL